MKAESSHAVRVSGVGGPEGSPRTGSKGGKGEKPRVLEFIKCASWGNVCKQVSYGHM